MNLAWILTALAANTALGLLAACSTDKPADAPAAPSAPVQPAAQQAPNAADGRMVVSDYNNSRVLIYNRLPQSGPGAADGRSPGPPEGGPRHRPRFAKRGIDAVRACRIRW